MYASFEACPYIRIYGRPMHYLCNQYQTIERFLASLRVSFFPATYLTSLTFNQWSMECMHATIHALLDCHSMTSHHPQLHTYIHRIWFWNLIMVYKSDARWDDKLFVEFVSVVLLLLVWFTNFGIRNALIG